MGKTIAQRLLIVIPMLFIIATAAFFLVSLIPGSPGRTILGETAPEADVVALDHQLGYDQPLIQQYLSWLSRVVRLDFGTSIVTGRSAVTDISNRIPITLSIVAGAMLLTVVIGVVLGVLSATRGATTDRLVQAGSGFAMAVPSFWLAVLLVLIFSVWLGVLPATGYVPFARSPGRWFESLILPCLAVSLVGVAAITRQTRSAMLHVLDQDYIRSLRAAGISNRSVVFKHALRNASTPIVTNAGFQFIGLLGSTVIIETVFGINGIGQLTLSSVNAKDLPMVLTIVIYTTFMVVVVNLIVDLINIMLNPKVRQR